MGLCVFWIFERPFIAEEVRVKLGPLSMKQGFFLVRQGHPRTSMWPQTFWWTNTSINILSLAHGGDGGFNHFAFLFTPMFTVLAVPSP